MEMGGGKFPSNVNPLQKRDATLDVASHLPPVNIKKYSR